MRIQPSNYRTTVTRTTNPRRPIALAVGSLAFTLSEAEARRLADQLVDATEADR
ncbi:hypothetical protein GS966_02520 [Rhodococcus hoagii]|nr:hypothetical protein [Prescottella equi]NKZ88802.1 hypothetical protein [Prescottella equi]